MSPFLETGIPGSLARLPNPKKEIRLFDDPYFKHQPKTLLLLPPKGGQPKPGWSRRSFFYGRLLPAISGGSSQAKLQATDFRLFLFYFYWKRDEIPSLIESGKSSDTSIPANKLT